MAPMDDPTDLTIAAMWDNAQAEFRTMVGKDLKDNANVTMEALVQKLETNYNNKNADEKRRKVKKFAAVLENIKNLAAIAGAGAEDAFTGAKSCFSAVSFLVSIPTRISQVYEHISDMFDQIQSVIWQHKILARVESVAKLDPSLRENTHAMLISFVRMVAMAYKVLNASGWGKFKVGLKASLGDTDQGYLNELQEFEKLSVKQDRLYNSLNHELGQGTKQVVERMHVMMQNQDAERKAEITKKDVERELLGVDDEKTQKARKDQKTRLAAFREQHLQGSGTWIASNEYYQKWRDHGAACQPLLMVRGKARSGKSHLIPAVLDDLENGEGSNKLLSAVYIFDRQDFTDKDNGGANHPALKTALRNMASQIAESSPPYMRELHAVLQSRSTRNRYDRRNETLEDVWNQLRFATGKNEATYVLIFDGLETLPPLAAESLLSLLASPRGGSAAASASAATIKLRILATGTPEIFSKRSVGPLMDMSESDNVDIVRYIEHRMENESVLKDLRTQSPDDAQRFSDIIASDADGDFGFAKSSLDSIVDALRFSGTELEDIDEILRNPERDVDKLAKRTLDELNQQLKPTNIEQLNEILKWVVYGHHPTTGDRFRLGDVNIIASLSAKRAAAMSFKAKILDKDMFGRVLDLETLSSDTDEFVVIRPELIDLFMNMGRQEETAAAEDGTILTGEPRISLTISIASARPDQVRRYLWDLSERVAFDPFFFNRPLTGAEHAAKIHVEPIDARATILDTCLKLLGEDKKESTRMLGLWAIKHLPYHIRWAAQNFVWYPDVKGLVLNLASLLTEVDTTVQHWTEWKYVHEVWLDAETVKAVHYILRRAQRDLFGDFRALEKRLLQRLLREPGDISVFTVLTLKLGEHWLLGDSWDVLPSYNWVDWYLDGQERVIETQQLDDVWDDNLMYEYWDWDRGSVVTQNYDNDDDVSESTSDENDQEDENEDEDEDADDQTDDNDTVATAAADAALEGHPEKFDPENEDNLDQGFDAKNDELDEPASITTKARIVRAADWVATSLNIKKKDANWHARLGKTFMLNNEFDEALSVFDQIPEHERNSNYTIRESKARALAGKKDFSGAVLEMNEALILLREIPHRTKDQQAGLIDSCRTLAGWYIYELKSGDDAADLYGEVLDLDSTHWETYEDLFNVWHDQHDAKDNSSIADLLKSMTEKPSGKSLSRIAEFFRYIANSGAPQEFFIPFFALIERADVYSLAFDSLEEASHYPEDERKKARFEIASFTVFKGLLTALQDRTPDGLSRAFKLWDEGLQTLEHKDFTDWPVTDWAVELVQNYHYQKALASGPESSYHAQQLADLTRNQPNNLQNLGQNAFLARYYTITGQEDKAKKLLTPIVTEILQNNTLLTAADCGDLAEIYCKLGDDAQALSAWSQCGPDTMDLICNAMCGKKWDRAGDFWQCKACPYTRFCDSCLGKVKTGTLEYHWCHRDHDWLHVPAWPEGQEQTATDGNVLWGGTLVAGAWHRDGSEVLEPKEWLFRIQDEWDIEHGNIELSSDGTRSNWGETHDPVLEDIEAPQQADPLRPVQVAAQSIPELGASVQKTPYFPAPDRIGDAYGGVLPTQGDRAIDPQAEASAQQPQATKTSDPYVRPLQAQHDLYAGRQQQPTSNMVPAPGSDARYVEPQRALGGDDSYTRAMPPRDAGPVSPDYAMTASAGPGYNNPYDGDGYGHAPWMDQRQPPQSRNQLQSQAPQSQQPPIPASKPQYDQNRPYQSPTFQEQRRASPVSRKPVGGAPSGAAPPIQNTNRKPSSPLTQAQFQDPANRPQSYQSPPPPLPPQVAPQDQAYASASNQWNQRPTSRVPVSRVQATQSWVDRNSLPPDAGQVAQGARYQEMPSPYQGSSYQGAGGSVVNEPRWGQPQPGPEGQQAAGRQGAQRTPQWTQKWTYDSYGS